MPKLTTTAQVMDAIGLKTVAELTGRTRNAASNWKSFKHFPPDTYLVLRDALEARGHTAPPSLWRMVETA